MSPTSCGYRPLYRGESRGSLTLALRCQLLLHLRCSSGRSSSCRYSSDPSALSLLTEVKVGACMCKFESSSSNEYRNMELNPAIGNPGRIKQLKTRTFSHPTAGQSPLQLYTISNNPSNTSTNIYLQIKTHALSHFTGLCVCNTQIFYNNNKRCQYLKGINKH